MLLLILLGMGGQPEKKEKPKTTIQYDIDDPSDSDEEDKEENKAVPAKLQERPTTRKRSDAIKLGYNPYLAKTKEQTWRAHDQENYDPSNEDYFFDAPPPSDAFVKPKGRVGSRLIPTTINPKPQLPTAHNNLDNED